MSNTLNALSEPELNAMIRLLDDTDHEIYDHVEKRLLDIGNPVIPYLEKAWESSMDYTLQQRIQAVIHKIQYLVLKHDLVNWSKSSGANAYENMHEELLQGALLVAKYQYPDLDLNVVMAQLNKLKKEIWLELNDNLSALEKIKVINHIFFGEHGYAGNTTNYHSPQNSFINTVLDSKKGNPLLLSIIYSYIAQSNGIPVYGVNLPDHFILAYEDPSIAMHSTQRNYPAVNVLFYINAFSRGAIFNSEEIDSFLSQLKITRDPLYYKPCNNLHIVQRMLRNLSFSYKKLGDTEKSKELHELLLASQGKEPKED